VPVDVAVEHGTFEVGAPDEATLAGGAGATTSTGASGGGAGSAAAPGEAR
jgi:hypothetical protein